MKRSVFNMIQKPSARVSRGFRRIKFQTHTLGDLNTMLIDYYDSDDIVHKESFHRTLLYSSVASWRFEAFSMLCSSYLSRISRRSNVACVSLYHSLHSPNLAPFEFYLVGKLHLPMKKKFWGCEYHPKGLYSHPEGHLSRTSKRLIWHAFIPCKARGLFWMK